ncbi:E2-like conjugating enzyme atg10 [Schistosoma haematobium]|uniref:Ubiquitin-like-conjugating enzyme ATG10 n=1 Tax=Schistosoma haematobium TaxID=6185 RepID=A0A922LJP0_SCHHA|nr:E2-like conjugating enzyme atg10 [Schistosoma haematobium]KAH9587490.1 E2-like conjugating enzyme atg10 [Schistosoma haematobium]
MFLWILQFFTQVNSICKVKYFNPYVLVREVNHQFSCSLFFRNHQSGQLTLIAYKDAIQTLKNNLICDSDSGDEWFIDEFVGYPDELEMVYRKPILLGKSNTSCLLTSESLLSGEILAEYRIVFSHSYQVPVLLMRFQTKSGRSLHHDKLWSENFRSSVFPLSEVPLSLHALSEIEHPRLGIPFYEFHPCKTADLMKEVFYSQPTQLNDPVKYMIMWLSLIASPFGLHLPQKSLLT